MAKVIAAQLEGIHFVWKILILGLFVTTLLGLVGAFYNIFFFGNFGV